jgi:hypothetical protein
MVGLAATALVAYDACQLAAHSHFIDDLQSARSSADADWSKAPQTDDERLCADFIALKNAHKSEANRFLAELEPAPDGAVARAVADRLQTDYFLRQDFEVVGARRGRTKDSLVLITRGKATAPAVQIRDGDRIETEQRTMFNLDLTVEVRQGKIYGVRADLPE